MNFSTLSETINEIEEKHQISFDEQGVNVECISYNENSRYCLTPNHKFEKIGVNSKKMLQVIINRLDSGYYELISYVL